MGRQTVKQILNEKGLNKTRMRDRGPDITVLSIWTNKLP